MALWGVALMIWLPVEESWPGWALVFAFCLTLLGALSLRWKFGLCTNGERSPRKQALFCLLLGIGTGAAVSPVAVLIMAFKTGLHAHNLPDYNIAEVLAVLWLTPLFSLLGLVTAAAGLGLEKLLHRK